MNYQFLHRTTAKALYNAFQEEPFYLAIAQARDNQEESEEAALLKYFEGLPLFQPPEWKITKHVLAASDFPGLFLLASLPISMKRPQILRRKVYITLLV